MTAIKICGITRAEDAELAVSLGVQALGFVLWPHSPRAISLHDASRIVHSLLPLVTSVAVFVDPTVDQAAEAIRAGFGVVQVHGTAPDWNQVRRLTPRAVRAVRLANEDESAIDGIVPAVDDGATVLLDAYDPVRLGGTGQVIDWTRAARVAARRRVILAGGLTPANVSDAVRVVRPYGVDVASGVEASPGIKDAEKMRMFVDAVRSAQ